VGFGLVIFRRFFILFSLLILVACSSNPKVVRVPTPLLEMSSPYALEKQWQLQMDAFNAADSHGLYVAETAESVYFATPNGGLTKAKKANQPRWQDQVVWQIKLQAPITAGPTVYTDKVVIGTAKGQVMALRQSDGAIAWMTQLSSEVISRPVIAEGKVFVRSVDGKVVALNIQTGAKEWGVEHGLPNLSFRGLAPITYASGHLYIGWETGQAQSLDAKTGELNWQTQVIVPSGRTDLERMVDIQAALIVKGERLFVFGYQGKLTALNVNTGNLYWSKEISGFRNFVVDDKAIYLLDEDDLMSAFDFVNGTQLWQQQNFKYRQLRNLNLYQDTQLLVADGQGYLHWIDKLDGTPIARTLHGSPHLGSSEEIARIQVSGQQLYVLDNDGFLTVYRVKPSDWYQFNHPEDPLKLFSRAASPLKDTQ